MTNHISNKFIRQRVALAWEEQGQGKGQEDHAVPLLQQQQSPEEWQGHSENPCHPMICRGEGHVPMTVSHPAQERERPSESRAAKGHCAAQEIKFVVWLLGVLLLPLPGHHF